VDERRAIASAGFVALVSASGSVDVGLEALDEARFLRI
jgi:hypothetical protein